MFKLSSIIKHVLELIIDACAIDSVIIHRCQEREEKKNLFLQALRLESVSNVLNFTSASKFRMLFANW